MPEKAEFHVYRTAWETTASGPRAGGGGPIPPVAAAGAALS
jgi:hypothetical protein